MTGAGRVTADDHVIKTYRYLRLAMVFLVALLAVAVLREGLTRDPGCWETSISSYYYTPVRAVFVSVLVAIGVCLVVLKGNTEHEDVLLNLAGMLAFGVAFVPTPAVGVCREGAATDVPAIRDNVANNVFALLVVGAAALVWAVVSARRAGGGSQWQPVDVAGAIAAAVVVVGGAVAFAAARDGFLRWAHDVSAVTMFLCLVVVMGLNAVGVGRRRSTGSTLAASLRTGYAAVGAAMVLTLAVVVVLRLANVGFAHLILWLEAALIVEFAAFWLIQTRELWQEGLRPG